MQNKPGVREIAADRVSRLPWLAPPAGYILLIKDVAYGNRYIIARHQQLDSRQIKRGARFPFETRVALILEADNAAEAERDLQDELAAGTVIGDWFDLDRFPQTPPVQLQQRKSMSLRELARNDEEAESLLRDMQLVGAGSQAHEPSVGRRGGGGQARLKPWALLLVLLAVAAAVASERSIDFRNLIDSVLAPSPLEATSHPTAQPTTQRAGADHSSLTPATRIRLAQPKILLAERTATTLRFNWYKMPQAKSYQYRFSINGGAHSAWRTANGFTLKLEGLSPGDHVSFQLRALRDGLYSALAQISAETLPPPTPTATVTAASTATEAPPTAASTATEAPPTAASTATDPPPTAASTATDPPAPTATATVELTVKYVVETAGGVNANIRSCPSTTCDIVAKYPPSAEVDVLGRVRGETVYDTDVWLEIGFEGGQAYLHSELVAEAD